MQIQEILGAPKESGTGQVLVELDDVLSVLRSFGHQLVNYSDIRRAFEENDGIQQIITEDLDSADVTISPEQKREITEEAYLKGRIIQAANARKLLTEIYNQDFDSVYIYKTEFQETLF